MPRETFKPGTTQDLLVVSIESGNAGFKGYNLNRGSRDYTRTWAIATVMTMKKTYRDCENVGSVLQFPTSHQ